MTLKATDLMRKEWESVNQFTMLNGTTSLVANISTSGLIDRVSVLGCSSTVLPYIKPDLFNVFQDSIVKKAALGFVDYALEARATLSQAMIGAAAAQGIFDPMDYLNVIKDSFALHKLRGIDSLGNIQRMAGISLPDTLANSLGLVSTLASLQESFATRAMAGLKTYEDMMATMAPYASLNIAQRASTSLLGLNSIQESMGFRASAIQQTVRTIQDMRLAGVPESVAKAIEQLQSSGMFSKTIEALNHDNMFAQAMKSFNALDYSGQSLYDISDYELSESITLIENSSDDNFLDMFTNLHPTIRAIFLFCFLQIIMPQLNNICSSLMMPAIDKAIGSAKLNTDQVRAIKKTPLQGIDTENIRFITRNDVKLRTKPAAHSEVLDVLVIGQIFQVVNKKRGWAEIVYYCDDGQMCRGWVLTTYTAKFKNR